MIRFAKIGLAGVLLAMASAASAWAMDATPWVTTPQTEVRLIAAEDGAGADGVVQLGLHFKLKDGWKVYWRRPGDAGFPPRLDWSESENFKDAEFFWPAPMRFEVLGFHSGSTGGPAFANPRADHVAPNEARVWTAGVSWYPNRWVRLQGNAMRETFENADRTPVPGDSTFWSGVLRMQVVL